VHVAGGAHEEAEAALQKALAAAEAGRAQYAKLRASLELARVNASYLRRADEAERWLEYAQATAKSLGDVPGLRYRVPSIRGRISWVRREYEQSEILYREAVALAQATEGERSAVVGELLIELAAPIADQGRQEETYPIFHRALEILEEALSPDHPHVGRLLQNLAQHYVGAGRLDQARPLLQRAIDIFSKESSSHHLGLAYAHRSMGESARLDGDHAQAIVYFDRALKVTEASVGAEHPVHSGLVREKALTLMLQDRFAEALPLYRRRLAYHEAGPVEDPVVSFEALVELADAEAMLGMTAEAQAHLDRALLLFDRPPGNLGPWAALVQASLSWRSPKQRRKVVRMVEKIRADASPSTEARTVLLRQRAERWLATHRD
jgi:tetratricopeptide (TPR) repeat protein